MDVILPANVLEAFPEALHLWHDYELFGSVVVVVVVATAAVIAGVMFGNFLIQSYPMPMRGTYT